MRRKAVKVFGIDVRSEEFSSAAGDIWQAVYFTNVSREQFGKTIQKMVRKEDISIQKANAAMAIFDLLADNSIIETLIVEAGDASYTTTQVANVSQNTPATELDIFTIVFNPAYQRLKGELANSNPTTFQKGLENGNFVMTTSTNDGTRSAKSSYFQQTARNKNVYLQGILVIDLRQATQDGSYVIDDSQLTSQQKGELIFNVILKNDKPLKDNNQISR